MILFFFIIATSFGSFSKKFTERIMKVCARSKCKVIKKKILVYIQETYSLTRGRCRYVPIFMSFFKKTYSKNNKKIKYIISK